MNMRPLALCVCLAGASAALAADGSAKLSAGVYRLPYADDTVVKVPGKGVTDSKLFPLDFKANRYQIFSLLILGLHVFARDAQFSRLSIPWSTTVARI